MFTGCRLALVALAMLALASAYPMQVIAAYDGDWLERAVARDFSQTALSLVGITGWYSIAPFFLAALTAVAAVVAASARPTLRARDAIAALLALAGWGLVALAATNPAGHAPSTTYVLAIVLVAGLGTLAAARKAA